MQAKEGMIYVFTGDGKGKTSAGLGAVIRMLLCGNKVEWISWYKEESWSSSEMSLGKVFPDLLKMHWIGKGFFGGPLDHETLEVHRTQAKKALKLGEKVLSSNVKKNEIKLLVLDEVLKAIEDNLMSVDELKRILALRGKTHVILTGHKCPIEIEEISDLVTEMKKVKHPYDKGILAIPGLDF